MPGDSTSFPIPIKFYLAFEHFCTSSFLEKIPQSYRNSNKRMVLRKSEPIKYYCLIKKNKEIMKSSSKSWIALGFGILAGGAAGYYLASDEGKKMRKKAKKQMKKLNTDVRHAIKDQSDVLSSKLENLAQVTQSWANEMASSANDVIEGTSENIKEATDKAKSTLKDGVSIANQKIKRKTEQLEKSLNNGQA